MCENDSRMAFTRLNTCLEKKKTHDFQRGHYSCEITTYPIGIQTVNGRLYFIWKP